MDIVNDGECGCCMCGCDMTVVNTVCGCCDLPHKYTEEQTHKHRYVNATALLHIAGMQLERQHQVRSLHVRCEHNTTRWRLGVVVSVVGRINEVNQHRARLVHDG